MTAVETRKRHVDLELEDYKCARCHQWVRAVWHQAFFEEFDDSVEVKP